MKMSIFAEIFLTVIMLALRDFVTTTATTSSTYYRLTQDLRSREAVKGRVPPNDGLVPIVVNITYVPLEILDIDDARQVVSVSSSIVMQWMDPALAWDTSTTGPYANLSSVELPGDEIWKPVLFVSNGASDDLFLQFSHNPTIFSTGMVTIVTAQIVKVTCGMDLWLYPFDTQTCPVIFPLVSTAPVLARAERSEILARNEKIMNDEFHVRGEWELIGFVNENLDLAFMLYPSVQYILTMKRKSMFYVSSFIVPLVLTSYMNALVFVIPPEGGERVSYLVSIFVSNAFFVSFCTDQMPQGMASIPLIMYLLLGVIMQSAILIFLVSVLMRYSQGPSLSDVTDDTSRDGSLNITQQKAARSKNAIHPSDVKVSNLRAREMKSWMIDLLLFIFVLIANTIFLATLFLHMI